MRSMVEAMGVEPMSALQTTPSTTCLFFAYTLCSDHKDMIMLHKMTCDTVLTTKPFNLIKQFYLVLYE